MYCSLSGEIPVHPVVTRSGHVYERRLLEKYLQENQRDPVNGDALSMEDVIEVQTSPMYQVKPRPPTATSIPSMLMLFQQEWDAMALETFTLKQQLLQTRQELSHALYQYDASTRVIARMIKERDEARSMLASFKPATAAAAAGVTSTDEDQAMEVETSETLPADIVEEMDATALTLSTGRRQRKPPQGMVTVDEVETFELLQSLRGVHKGSILAMDVHPNQPHLVVTGGADKLLRVHDLSAAPASRSSKVTCKGHTQPVLDLSISPDGLLLSGSKDGSINVWRPSANGAAYETEWTCREHEDAVTRVAFLPTQRALFCSAGEDGRWALHDVEASRTLTSLVPKTSASSYSCGDLHPDGLLWATGSKQGVVQVWDLKSQSVAFECPAAHGGGVSSLAFSGNGYTLVTTAAEEAPGVQVWDLRKLKQVQCLEVEHALAHVRFNPYGNLLGVVGSAGARMVTAKPWASVWQQTTEGEATRCLFTGPTSSEFVVATSTGALQVFGLLKKE